MSMKCDHSSNYNLDRTFNLPKLLMSCYVLKTYISVIILKLLLNLTYISYKHKKFRLSMFIQPYDASIVNLCHESNYTELKTFVRNAYSYLYPSKCNNYFVSQLKRFSLIGSI